MRVPGGAHRLAQRGGDDEVRARVLGGAGVVGGEHGTGAERMGGAEGGAGAGEHAHGVRTGERDLDQLDTLLRQRQDGAQRGIGVATSHDGDQTVGGQRGLEFHGGVPSSCTGNGDAAQGQRQTAVKVSRHRTSPEAGTLAASPLRASARSKTRPSIGSTPVLR